MNMKLQTFLILVVVMLTLGFSSCDDKYGEDLRGIGHRVEVLEDTVLLKVNAQIKTLVAILKTIDNNGYVTKKTKNPDGTYTLEFTFYTFDENNMNITKTVTTEITLRDGADGKDGKDGKDGNTDNFVISVKEGSDGVLYWTLNGEWILTNNGERMRASAIDGKDGAKGKDDINMTLPVPQVRINPVTRMWEISTDGGYTYMSTGISANGQDGTNGKDGQNGKDGMDGKDGKDGTDGKDGKNGKDDVFMSVIFSYDYKTAFITLRDNTTTLSIPIIGFTPQY